MYPAKTRFGGVPISVPIPPIDAPYAIASIRQTAKFRASRPPTFIQSSAAPLWSSPAPRRWFFTRSTTEAPIGSIITAVAVLETHMLMRAVASMNPAINRRGLVPTIAIVTSAMRAWSPLRCMASPSIRPPANRKMISLA
jgi:hypothetical protein